MFVKESIWYTIKVLILMVLISVIAVFISSTIILYYGYGQIRTVGEVMQSELSKNNTIYLSSYITGDASTPQLVGFSKQLQDINAKTDGMYKFKGIRVKNADGSVITLLTIDEAEDGTQTVNFNEDAVGAYGDFRTIELLYDVTFSYILPTSAQISSIERFENVSTVHFDFVAPCLRYLK